MMLPSRTPRIPAVLALTALVLAFAEVARAAELVSTVRGKLAAGDLSSGEAAVEDYRAKTGVDKEYLNAVGWLARGAEMQGKRDRAAGYVAELRKEIKEETPDNMIALGAAIEVEGRLRLHAEGRAAALRFWEGELSRAKDPALRSRIRKNMNLVSLEGQRAPELSGENLAGGKPARLAGLMGRPVLLFFWAHWCGDCKAEAAKLGRIAAAFAPRGLAVVAPTRLYGTGADNKDVSPEEERAHMAKIWGESYAAGLSGIGVPIDAETMVRYGVSATPTYVLIDKAGVVQLYAPTRLSEAELRRRIEGLL